MEELVPSAGSKGMARNFNYDVIVDFVKQGIFIQYLYLFSVALWWGP